MTRAGGRGRARFRVTLWPTLFTIPAILVMLGLGVWQVQRLHWKTDLIDTFESRIVAAPIAPPSRIADLAAMRFRRVEARGRFLHEAEIQVTGRPHEGTAGFHIVTPFRTGDGVVVLVNRGWVPLRLHRSASRPETLPPGEVTLRGIIRRPGRPGRFVPDNEPENGIWLWIDIDAIAADRSLDGLANYVVDAIRDPTPGRLPIGAETVIRVRNEHLQYAITWFALAATLLVIYGLYHYRRDPPAEAPPPEDEGPAPQ